MRLKGKLAYQCLHKEVGYKKLNKGNYLSKNSGAAALLLAICQTNNYHQGREELQQKQEIGWIKIAWFSVALLIVMGVWQDRLDMHIRGLLPRILGSCWFLWCFYLMNVFFFKGKSALFLIFVDFFIEHFQDKIELGNLKYLDEMLQDTILAVVSEAANQGVPFIFLGTYCL